MKKMNGASDCPRRPIRVVLMETPGVRCTQASRNSSGRFDSTSMAPKPFWSLRQDASGSGSPLLCHCPAAGAASTKPRAAMESMGNLRT